MIEVNYLNVCSNPILILLFQTWFSLLFKIIVGAHSLEIIYTVIRCRQLGLTVWTTIKWIVNVAFNGIFALRMLIDPEFEEETASQRQKKKK